MSLDGVFSKAVTTTTGSADGNVGNFLPTPLYNQFIELLREKTFTRSLFRTINMPNAVLDIPAVSAGTQVYYQSAEATSGVETSITASKITLTARKLMAQVLMSKEVLEDANQNLQSVMTRDFASSLAAAEEEAFLVGRTSTPTVAGHNGTAANNLNIEKIQTTTNIWEETGTAALNGVAGYNYDKTANLICDGVVSVGLDSGNVIDAGGESFYGTTAYTLLRQAINQLGVLGRNKKDLALIINPVASSQLLMSTELMTLEKYGRDATILTGEVGQLFGVKVLESTFLPSGTGTEVDSAGDETGGTYTGASQVYGLGGVAVLVHVPSVMVGDRRKVSINTEEVLEYDAFRTVLTSRVAFGVERTGCVSVIGNLDADVGLESE
tara:strand:+ start:4115 stop:5260 length:1146 start_codon:yes stop_codon:yes gene_type:complete